MADESGLPLKNGHAPVRINSGLIDQLDFHSQNDGKRPHPNVPPNQSRLEALRWPMLGFPVVAYSGIVHFRPLI